MLLYADDEFGKIVTKTIIPTVKFLQNNAGLKKFLDSQLFHFPAGIMEPCNFHCTNIKEADAAFKAVKKKQVHFICQICS